MQRQMMHARKLKDIKGRRKGTGTVDSTAPETTRMKHLQVNLKKEQLLEERFSEIERENGILLGKIVHIETHSVMGEKFANPNPSRGDAVKGHSLNEVMRKRELMRIGAENEALLRRIMSRKPNYDHVDWEADNKKSEQYLKALSKVFPKPEFAGLSPSAPSARGSTTGGARGRSKPPAGAILAPLESGSASAGGDGGSRGGRKGRTTKRAESAAELVFEMGRKMPILSHLLADDGSEGNKSISLSLDVYAEADGSLRVSAKSLKRKDAFSPLLLSAEELAELLPEEAFVGEGGAAAGLAEVGRAVGERLEVREIDGHNMLVLRAARKIHLARLGRKCVPGEGGGEDGRGSSGAAAAAAGEGGEGSEGGEENYAVLIATKYAPGLLKVSATETSGASQNLLVSVRRAAEITGDAAPSDMETLAQALLEKAAFVRRGDRNVLSF